MKCNYCGAEINNGSKFCTECGHEVQRERTILDPLPELDGYRRLRNKMYFFDDKSDFFSKFSVVMIAILAIFALACFIMKVQFIPFFAIGLIALLLLLRFANNHPGKYVKFEVGRSIVVIIPFLTALLMFAAFTSVLL